jgi:hypothetical protein
MPQLARCVVCNILICSWEPLPFCQEQSMEVHFMRTKNPTLCEYWECTAMLGHKCDGPCISN